MPKDTQTKKEAPEKEMPTTEEEPLKFASKIMPLLEQSENRLPLFLGAALIILAGVVSGYFLAQQGISLPQGKIVGTPKKIVGSKDTSIFKDKAEGVIEKGGVDGEGTHKLLREGGSSQTAYLTSSVVDLNEFVGKKVRVWGETFAAQKAGWLMDVGRVEVLE